MEREEEERRDDQDRVAIQASLEMKGGKERLGTGAGLVRMGDMGCLDMMGTREERAPLARKVSKGDRVQRVPKVRMGMTVSEGKKVSGEGEEEKAMKELLAVLERSDSLVMMAYQEKKVESVSRVGPVKVESEDPRDLWGSLEVEELPAKRDGWAIMDRRGLRGAGVREVQLGRHQLLQQGFQVNLVITVDLDVTVLPV